MNPQTDDKALRTPLGPPIRKEPEQRPMEVAPGIIRNPDGKLSTNLPPKP